MAKARKMPSGNWRIQIYTHTDENGKRHYESFSAPTKQQVEMKAMKYLNDMDRMRADDITVEEAVTRYIDTNEKVLSPSTINGYRVDARRFKSIAHLKIRKLTSTDIQEFINSMIDKGLSPKSIRNTWGLLRSSLMFSGIEQHFRIHLPANPIKKKNAPENDQVMELYNNASHNMKVAIMLAARHSLRRGEICGLKYKDLTGDVLYVHSDVVKSADGHSWVHKEIPKTADSNREVFLSQQDLELIGTGDPEEYIVPVVPTSIGTNFDRLKKRTGINIRFHDLRVYFASISAAMGIPELFTATQGGWKEGSQVLREHYKKPIASINEGYARKLNQYFDEITKNDSAQNAT